MDGDDRRRDGVGMTGIEREGLLRRVTQVRIVVGQPVEHWVECANEEVVSQLHNGQPQQVPQVEPGQHTTPETHN